VTIGGEVVVDYSLRLKRELRKNRAVWVFGYFNDVMGYILSYVSCAKAAVRMEATCATFAVRPIRVHGQKPQKGVPWIVFIFLIASYTPDREQLEIGFSVIARRFGFQGVGAFRPDRWKK